MDISKLKFAELPEELVTGVDTIDRQHAALITIINHLLASAQEGEGKNQLQNIVNLKLNFSKQNSFIEIEMDIKNRFILRGLQNIFDRYRVPLYKEASYKPYIIAAMIFLSKVPDGAKRLQKMLDEGNKRFR